MTPTTRAAPSQPNEGREVAGSQGVREHVPTTQLLSHPATPTLRAVTIQDVAALSGVSISTVSRVVTGSVAVEPATAERVKEAISTLGYRPNLLARSFR